MKELIDLKMGALDEKEMDACIKEHFIKKFGNLIDIHIVKIHLLNISMLFSN